MKEPLKNRDIFEGLGKGDAAVLEKLFIRKEFDEGEIIIKAGEINRELFIVHEGRITSEMKLPGNIDRKHGVFLPGDFFGEISFFAGRPQFTTYRAVEKSVLLSINKKNFSDLIENNPGSSIKLISRLLGLTIQKLRNTSRFLSDVVEWGENASRRTVTDELTGVYNRAFLEDAFENFFNISKSNNKPLSLFMIDLDDFREINEKWGLEAGNRILLELVGLIKNLISRHGIIARYGGDEFSILLPEADLKKSLEIAEQIRKNVEMLDFSGHTSGIKIRVTTSIGISSFPETATELESFKAGADESLYKAKEMGKNRVVHA
ncbi:MAG: GGDEF domain-containing protein [Spirochaetes bacterium]|jgi:diguanylate cyclase (GGDEF)-like protein|nr:GGDEF domain-containing protein [Spirochaetota bacterium]